ncbi:relaxase/mobilization nuclease domain-containing protein [Hallella multisaccharivorax]|uniref:relaxase/mobilization nuclease domain-containing protein n=1 Tax=Hallella multisaccharivorax TaxID=310514 RepID=UPI0036111ADA
MIATILPSSTTFHAVEYNERKVAKGVAELLEMRNFDSIMPDSYTTEQLQNFLAKYSAANENIRNTQFHVAISCRGHEYSQEQLLDIAHRYLDEMGYAENGQPVLIYAHHDTGNNHLHIVTSRVDPSGHKINHSHERIRSLEAIGKIVGEDEQLRADLYVKEAMAYHFESFTQFRAIMQSSGYECFERDDSVCVARGGHVLAKINREELARHFQKTVREEDTKRRRQLRAILRKYHNIASNRAELADMLKRKFGIDLIFFGAKDKPYGYMIVDHHRETVYQGSTFFPIKHLQQFMSDMERIGKIEQSIDAMLEEHPQMIISELNRMLWRQYGTRVSKGEITLPNKKRIELSETIKNTLRFNYMLHSVQTFAPQSETEQALLSAIWKIDNPTLISLGSKKKSCEATICDLRAMISTKDAEVVQNMLHDLHISIFRIDGSHYGVDFRRKVIFCLEDEGLDIRQLHTSHLHEACIEVYGHGQPQLPAVIPTPTVRLLLGQPTSPFNRNAEWEVGGYDDEIDDERKLKR